MPKIPQSDKLKGRSGEVEPRYASVRCPTTIWWGQADQWIPIEAGHRVTERIPAARFHAVQNAGHLMHEDAPGAIVGAVLNFLSRLLA